MDLFNQELMYEFHAKELTQTEALKQYADHTVREIKSALSWEADVQVSIEPVAKDKRLYSVSIGVFGFGNSIVVKKDGKRVLAVLRKVRRAVLRQIRKSNRRRLSHRRKNFLKEQFAS